jgi:preprotein translocase subunit YajC
LIVLFALLLQASAPAWAQFLPLVLIFGIFYFLLFLPMQRQKKQHAKMLNELKNGDAVQTQGGLVGTIVSQEKDDTLIIKVRPDNLKLQVLRSSVTALAAKESK